ncbi:XdhC family protein [Chloroflexota bacterium]
MTDIYEEIVKIKASGESAAIVTVITAAGSTPREEGAKMLVRTDGSLAGTIGGGRLESEVATRALDAIKEGKPKRLQFTLKEGEELGMICGGDVEVFIEPIVSAPTLYVFGGGHIALPLVRIGNDIGFKVIVIDDRPEFADPQRFPEADAALNEDFTKVFPKLKITKTSYLVIITYGHKYDELVLEKALATEAGYIGMIGSKNKVRTVFEHLRARGISQELLDKVHAPIGVEIGAESPAEIAVSIAAEIIKVRRTSFPTQ